jgi:hypothetical protein
VTDEERAEVLVTARLLRAASALQWLAVILTSYAVITKAFLAIALGAIALYFAFRVSFDAHLFEDITRARLTTEQLDIGLAPMRKTLVSRPWSDRCRGARRLVVFLAVASVAQLVALALA